MKRTLYIFCLLTAILLTGCGVKKKAAKPIVEWQEEEAGMVRTGMDLGDFVSAPARLEILERGENDRVRLVISEGKFHQVKRMFLAFNCKVTYLKRVSEGGVKLDKKLKPGEFRPLTEDELKTLKEE